MSHESQAIHSYTLQIVDASGKRTTILESETSMRRVRNVAQKIRQRPGRKLIILRDGKELRGGASALDQAAYDAWLEDHQPDEGGDPDALEVIP